MDVHPPKNGIFKGIDPYPYVAFCNNKRSNKVYEIGYALRHGMIFVHITRVMVRFSGTVFMALGLQHDLVGG
jgi:hypothetical protein